MDRNKDFVQQVGNRNLSELVLEGERLSTSVCTWPTTYFMHSIQILLLEKGSSAGLSMLCEQYFHDEIIRKDGRQVNHTSNTLPSLHLLVSRAYVRGKTVQ